MYSIQTNRPLIYFRLKIDKGTHQINPRPQKRPYKKNPCFVSKGLVGQLALIWRKLCPRNILCCYRDWTEKAYLHLCTLDNQPSQFLASFFHHCRKHILYHLLNKMGEQRKLLSLLDRLKITNITKEVKLVSHWKPRSLSLNKQDDEMIL